MQRGTYLTPQSEEVFLLQQITNSQAPLPSLQARLSSTSQVPPSLSGSAVSLASSSAAACNLITRPYLPDIICVPPQAFIRTTKELQTSLAKVIKYNVIFQSTCCWGLLQCHRLEMVSPCWFQTMFPAFFLSKTKRFFTETPILNCQIKNQNFPLFCWIIFNCKFFELLSLSHCDDGWCYVIPLLLHKYSWAS